MAATDVRTALSEQKKARDQRSWWNILKATASEWVDADAQTWAAALACYTLLAIAPLLVVAIKVITVLIGDRANEIVTSGAASWMGEASKSAIAEIISTTRRQGGGTIAAVVSLVLVAVSVGGVFSELQQAMNRMWKVKPKPGGAFWGFIRARVKSVLVMAIAAVLFLASVVATTWLESFTKRLGMQFAVMSWVIDAAGSIVLLTLLFALLYVSVPDAEIPWGSTWVGAFISAGLFTAGKYGLAIYFKWAAPSSAFGAVGSLAAILIWIYYSAQILLFGAQFTQVYARVRGHGVRPSKHAKFLSECNETETATPSPEDPGNKPQRPSVPYSTDDYDAALGGRSLEIGSRIQRPVALRDYVLAGAGAAVGALVGGYSAARSQPLRRPGAREVAAAMLDDRIRRVEQRVGRVSRIKTYLERENVNERIDVLHRHIQEIERLQGKRPSHNGGTNWSRRALDLARQCFR